MRRLAGGGLLVVVALGLSAWLGGQRASASGARAGATLARRAGLGDSATVRSSRLIFGGRARCTAIVSSEVEAGRTVRVRFVLHNRSKRRFVSSYEFGWFVLRAADGMTYDTRTSPQPEGGDGMPQGSPGLRLPTSIPPGGTVRFGSPAVPVRWKGPLRLTPGCVVDPLKALPGLRVRVTSPGTPSYASAVAQVVAATGHLLDHCRPQTAGVPVDGQIDAPRGSTPPMSAQCSVSINSEGRFSVAQVLVLTPGGPGFVELWQPYDTLWQPGLPPPTLSPPFEAIAWEFVVTRDGAIPVAASMMDDSYPSDQMLPFWYWGGTGWEFANTGVQCGASHFITFEWTGTTGPAIEFISACPAPSP